MTVDDGQNRSPTLVTSISENDEDEDGSDFIIWHPVKDATTEVNGLRRMSGKIKHPDHSSPFELIFFFQCLIFSDLLF